MSSPTADVADIADRVTPSVVSILSERSGETSRYDLGSGVIVSADGAIVTSSHVVEAADRVRVALKDGRTLDAHVVGTDPESDVAVLRVEATGLPPIRVGDSSELRTGDLVLAVGNPFGVGQTVTLGIVSAVGRSNVGVSRFDDLIQTDAAINPGNSGGALVDMNGALVGINTAIISRNGAYQGIGFAIPSRVAMEIKDALLEDGKFERGWLGVELDDVEGELAGLLGIAPHAGVLITEVVPAGPAANAGLEPGDLITAVDGVIQADAAQLRKHIAMAANGTLMRLDVVRQAQPRSVAVVLREHPEPVTVPEAHDESAEVAARLFAGVTVEDLDPANRAKFEVPDVVVGTVISALDPDSVALALGFQVGDVIVEVNQVPTPTAMAFQQAIGTDAEAIVVVVYREGAMLLISIAARD